MEKTKEQIKKYLVVSIIGALVIIVAILTSILFQFGLIANIVMSWLLTTVYALFAFFMIDPVVRINPVSYVNRPVLQRVVQIVERPTLREIQIPMENKTIEVVEKPVIQEVIRYVTKKVYVKAKPRAKKLNIPKFKFIASTQTRTYHKRTCKFSKMLKNKYKLHSNSKSVFKRKHFKACKTCLKQIKHKISKNKK